MVTALLVIAILVFLIVVHELGHFIAAKLFGVKVLEFGIGYPPRAFLLGKIGDTEYTLNWIPFGGFVRLFGEEEEHGSGSFVDAPRYKQAITLVAGVAMNAIAGFALFTGAYMVGILHTVDEGTTGAHLIVTTIVPGSPADAAGLKPGDELLSLHDNSTSAQLTPEGVLEYVSARAGQELEASFSHTGATTTNTAILRPAHAVISQDAGRPAVGVGLSLMKSQSMPFGQAVVEAYYQTIGTFKVVASGLWSIVAQSFHGAPDLSDVVGPVGLVGVVGEAARSGLGYVLSLAGFISINLVIINLLPIPALDGGRLVVVIIEAIMRRSAPKLAVQLVNTLGLALIILLMVTVTYKDIARLLF